MSKSVESLGLIKNNKYGENLAFFNIFNINL